MDGGGFGESTVVVAVGDGGEADGAGGGYAGSGEKEAGRGEGGSEAVGGEALGELEHGVDVALAWVGNQHDMVGGL